MSVVWSSLYSCHIESIESLQKTFLSSLAYKAHIKIYDNYRVNYNQIGQQFIIDQLQLRRQHFDILFVFEMLNGILCCSWLLLSISFNTYHLNPFHHANYSSSEGETPH